MKKHAPPVGQYMTHLPVEAERCETVADALLMMDAKKIHHIPVMSGSQLKGIVSFTDLLRAQSDKSRGGDTMALERLCQSDVFVVDPETPLDEVARGLLSRSCDAAVVMDGGFVVGICTATDIVNFVAGVYGQS